VNAQREVGFQNALVFSILLLASSLAGAQSFPGQSPDKQFIKYQQKANSLFEDGQYERAMTVYRGDLAPVGDKYAQYMIGYMYFSGSGVPQEQIIASAWYRLAAERGDESYVQVRDSLVPLLNDAQRQRSDKIFMELRSELGDAALLMNLLREDIEFLQKRQKSDKFNIDSLGRRNHDRKRTAYTATAERMKVRMDYVQKLLSNDALTSEAELTAYDALREEALAEIESLEEFERGALL
jgi:hypothetical protein